MSGKEIQKAKMIHAELKLPNKPGRLITNFEIQNLNQSKVFWLNISNQERPLTPSSL